MIQTVVVFFSFLNCGIASEVFFIFQNILTLKSGIVAIWENATSEQMPNEHTIVHHSDSPQQGRNQHHIQAWQHWPNDSFISYINPLCLLILIIISPTLCPNQVRDLEWEWKWESERESIPENRGLLYLAGLWPKVPVLTSASVAHWVYGCVRKSSSDQVSTAMSLLPGSKA